jgi:hypothetical protein
MSSTQRQNSLLISQDWTKIYQSFTNADFLSYDFETVRRSMLNYLSTNYPEDFNDYIDSSEYIAMIDMIAFLAQSLSFRIDLNARENYIDTASRRDSILRLAKLISYNPKRCQPAAGLLKIESINTTENVFDANGTNLANQYILWNDATNNNWYSQFITVMNSAMYTAQFGNPDSKDVVNGIDTELYTINSNNFDLPIFKFSSSIGGNSMAFEITPVTIDSNGYYEKAPQPGAKFSMLFRNDNQGSGSANSGWFVLFKQGQIQSNDFTVNNATSNEIIGVDVNNINETDFWLWQLSTAGVPTTLWTKLDSTVGSNAIYNNIKNKLKTFYSLSPRINDQVDINFSDGTYGQIPNGPFRAYYRVSNGLQYVVTPSDIVRISFNLPYISGSGNSETLKISATLQYTVTNAAASETDAEIKTNAPQVYYTQNRMITGEDYNITPVVANQNIIKVKALNRTSSGISRYFDIDDPTGTYSDIKIYASDGTLYKDTYLNQFTFSYTTRNELYGITTGKILPLFSLPETLNFYYEEFTRVTVNDIAAVWKTVTTQPNLTTGYFADATTGVALSVGQFTQNSLRYVAQGALVKFTAPAGYYIAPNDTLVAIPSGQTLQNIKDARSYIWAEVLYYTGDGSNKGTGKTDLGVGMVQISTNIPNGAVASQIIPLFVTTLPVTLQNEIVNQLLVKRTFGLRYDRVNGQFVIIQGSNLDLTSQFSQIYAGDISSQRKDSSWLIAFYLDGTNYVCKYRGLRYVFKSAKELTFYYDSNDKILNQRLGDAFKDIVILLGTNSQPTNNLALGPDYTWEITQELLRPDGIVDNTGIVVSFYSNQNDGVVHDPDAFNNIVNPSFVDPTTNTLKHFVYYQKQSVNGVEMMVPVDPTTVNTFAYETDIASFTSYKQGNLFYFYSEGVIKYYDTIQGLVLVNDILAFSGRSDLRFEYIHQASQDYRLDPAPTNIIDMYILTKSYDDAVRNYVLGINPIIPIPPSSSNLKAAYDSQLATVKTMSDEIVYHPAKYKYLFGNLADSNLQATFNIIKNPNSTATDNQVKAMVFGAINNYFDISNWDFGDSFNFGELSAYIIKVASPDVVNVLLVPKSEQQQFGSLYQIFAQPDEILISTAMISDIVIIPTVTSGILKGTGTVVTSTVTQSY